MDMRYTITIKSLLDGSWSFEVTDCNGYLVDNGEHYETAQIAFGKALDTIADNDDAD